MAPAGSGRIESGAAVDHQSRRGFAGTLVVFVVAGVAVCVLGEPEPARAAAAVPNKTIRASVSSSGSEGDNFSFASSPQGLSANGRYVVFESSASNLVPR